ncbi:type II toxin-antitoxin system VapC family toxin [Leucobacter viscericola]|uniref:Ribonuclease VapC n=1 Tax=Leucobacter viscericola TaxID=2714935 RepID=A0A6G7XC11_9MICO|nr:type II toxin-antitoxin system VapC family toxin [Leucobacter viscericola]QIK62134.1 type II toxin-antitoxin system VapC family toxin [Leucobacter viscericola]
MIVLDASAAVELLLALPLSRRVQDRLDQGHWQLAAPQLLVVEILQVLRRRVAAGSTSLSDAEEALELLQELGIRYFDHQVLAERVWQLRGNLSAYDASYVALAEALGWQLVTTDARLANAPGHSASVLLVN